jgi:signal transduction histidine kinase
MTHSLQIYRIIQELIHNAVKHSAADSVLIKLVERKKMLYISYQDNGKGMPAESINKNGMGLGMSSLKNRAEMLGGKISYSSRTNAGTEYFFEIPII